MKTYCNIKRCFYLVFLIFGITVFVFQACHTKKAVEENEDRAHEFVEEDRPKGVIAYQDTIKYEMPDEYVLLIFLRGDEHGHIAKTVDGYLLKMNDEGYYEYAMKDKHGNFISTGIIARNAKDRTEEVDNFLESLLDEKPVIE